MSDSENSDREGSHRRTMERMSKEEKLIKAFRDKIGKNGVRNILLYFIQLIKSIALFYEG
jgi:hypothetical protein